VYPSFCIFMNNYRPSADELDTLIVSMLVSYDHPLHFNQLRRVLSRYLIVYSDEIGASLERLLDSGILIKPYNEDDDWVGLPE